MPMPQPAELIFPQFSWKHITSQILGFSLGFTIILQPKQVLDFQLKQRIGAGVIWPECQWDVVGEIQSWNNWFLAKMACANILLKKKKSKPNIFFWRTFSFPDQLCWAPDLSLVLAFRAVNKPSKEVCKTWTKPDLQNLPLVWLWVLLGSRMHNFQPEQVIKVFVTVPFWRPFQQTPAGMLTFTVNQLVKWHSFSKCLFYTLGKCLIN